MRTLFGGIGDAFADRNFRIYSIGAIISWITYFVQAIAFSWITWQVTHSTLWLGVVAFLNVAASLVFLPIGGVLADRYDRLPIVMTAYGFDCAKAGVLCWLAATDRLSLLPICVASFAHGLIHSFSVPAAYGMIPRFVAPDKLANAIGVSAAYSQFAVFAGPAVAGWILVHWGVAAAFATNVAGYIVYFITMAFLRTPPGFRQARAARRTVGEEIFDGARYVFGHKGLASLMLLVLVGDAISVSVYRMVPAYAGLVLDAGVGSASLLFGMAGLGATFSALWLAHGGTSRARPERVLRAMLWLALSITLLAGSTGIVVAALAMLLFGYSGETRRSGTVAIMQGSVDDAQRGRVMAFHFLLTQLAGGIGTVAVGLAAQHAGLRYPLLAAAMAVAITWLVVFLRRREIATTFLA
jgi:MFS family permease